MTERAIQSLENAIESIAKNIEAMAECENANFKDIAYRVNAITRMNRLLPGVNETAPSERKQEEG